MEQFVDRTAHFEVHYDDATGIDGLLMAWALVQSCEADYQRCVVWFGNDVPYRSPDTPGYIRVLVLRDTQDWHGWNNGGGGFIQVFIGATPPDATSTRLVFVAELTEMFMEAQEGGWSPGDSKGEALSRLLATEAYPTAPALGLFFTGQSWLGTGEDPAGSGHRKDWVAQPEATDLNFDSIGCCILFLNYLRWQLGYPLEALIHASGNTLEALYEEVTGGTDGFAPFSALLNEFFPIGTHPAISDNPFPLLAATARRLTLGVDEVPDGPPAVVRTGTATERFIGCPPREYEYQILETLQTTVCTATPIGFGVTKIRWVANGVTIPAQQLGEIWLPVMLVEMDPLLPGSTSTPESRLFRFAASGRTLRLDLVDRSLLGTVGLEVQASVSDAFVDASQSLTAGCHGVAAYEIVQFDAAYYRDGAACANRFIGRYRRLAPPFDHLAAAVSVILTLPDPPTPDFVVALSMLERLAQASAPLYGLHAGEGVDEVRHFLASRLAGAPTLAARLLGKETAR